MKERRDEVRILMMEGGSTERSKTEERALYESRNDNFGGNVGM